MCDRTKKFLGANNIAYNEINIDENEDAIDQIIEYGFQSAPVVRVDFSDGTNDMWCGFRQDKIAGLTKIASESASVAGAEPVSASPVFA